MAGNEVCAVTDELAADVVARCSAARRLVSIKLH